MRNKGTPYLRRLRNTDRGDSMQTAFAMALFKKGYGMFRRGYIGICLTASMSKQEIKRKFSKPWKDVKKFFREKSF